MFFYYFHMADFEEYKNNEEFLEEDGLDGDFKGPEVLMSEIRSSPPTVELIDGIRLELMHNNEGIFRSSSFVTFLIQWIGHEDATIKNKSLCLLTDLLCFLKPIPLVYSDPELVRAVYDCFVTPKDNELVPLFEASANLLITFPNLCDQLVIPPVLNVVRRILVKCFSEAVIAAFKYLAAAANTEKSSALNDIVNLAAVYMRSNNPLFVDRALVFLSIISGKEESGQVLLDEGHLPILLQHFWLGVASRIDLVIHILMCLPHDIGLQQLLSEKSYRTLARVLVQMSSHPITFVCKFFLCTMDTHWGEFYDFGVIDSLLILFGTSNLNSKLLISSVIGRFMQTASDAALVSFLGRGGVDFIHNACAIGNPAVVTELLQIISNIIERNQNSTIVHLKENIANFIVQIEDSIDFTANPELASLIQVFSKTS